MLRHIVYLDKGSPIPQDHRDAMSRRSIDAVADIPPDRMRMHVCWGSTMAPHHTDVPLKDIVDIVLSAKARRRCRSRPPMRGTSTNGRSGAT